MQEGEKLHDNIAEKYWSRFPDTYDKKMEYVVGKELRNEIIQELNCLPELGEIVELGCGPCTFTAGKAAFWTFDELQEMYGCLFGSDFLKGSLL